jgi:multiple sugar transport system permease protein
MKFLSNQTKKSVRKSLLVVLAVILVCIVLFPIYWMVITAFSTPGTSFGRMPTLIPKEFHFDSIREVFEQRPLMQWVRNSLLIASVSTIFAVLFSTTAAYSISRFKFKGRGLMGLITLVSQMLPSVLLVIPMFVLFKELGLLNNFLSVIIAHISFTIPLCVWMMKGYFDSIDKSIEEAAMIDGCTRLDTFIRVILPISLPGLAATALYAFIQSWDEYLFARTFVNSESLYTASVGLASFIGQYITLKEHMMGAALIVTIPTLLVIFFLQKYLVAGLTEGANKG